MVGIFTIFALAFVSLAIALVAVFALLRRSFPGRIDSDLIDIGGTTFTGYEAMAGAAIAVAMVASLLVHGAIRDEYRETQRIELLLRWHPAFESSAVPLQQNASAAASLLTNSAMQAANPELLAMAAEAAVSLADRHCSTADAFRASWSVTILVVAGFMMLVLVHSIILSWRLTGLRLLMPLLLFSLLAGVLAVAFDFNNFVQREAGQPAFDKCLTSSGEP